MKDERVPSSPVASPPRLPFRTRSQGYFQRAVVSLQHRDFRYLAFSSLALGFGQWIQLIALGWLVFEVTGSAVQMAAVPSLRGLVSLAVTPLGGVLADRFNRRDVAAWSTVFACLQALALAYLVFAGMAGVWTIYLFAALEGVASSLYMPARQALVYNVVPRESLPNAIAMNSISQNIARVSGPALAGLVIGFSGTSAAFLLLGVVKLLAAALTLPIKGTAAPQKAAIKGESALESLSQAVRYSIKDPTIVALLVISVIPPVLVWPYVQMLPLFAELLGRGASGYGLLATAVGWGSLVGLVWLVLAGDIKRKGLVVLLTQLLYVVFVAAFAQSKTFELSMVMLALAGLALIVSSTLTNTLFQVIVPDEFRGRVLSLHTMSFGLQPVGALPMGVAISLWGAPHAVTLFMVLAAAVTLVVWMVSPALRKA